MCEAAAQILVPGIARSAVPCSPAVCSTPALVIGIGNPRRGDDAAGVLVARMLAGQPAPGVEVVEMGAPGLELLELWHDAELVVIADAVVSGAAPGVVHRFDASCKPLPATLSSDSTHMFGLAQIIELGRALHQLPSQLIIYGVEVKTLEMDGCLTPTVVRGVQVCVEQIQQEIGRLSILPS